MLQAKEDEKKDVNVSDFPVFVPKFLIQTVLLTSPMGHLAEV